MDSLYTLLAFGYNTSSQPRVCDIPGICVSNTIGPGAASLYVEAAHDTHTAISMYYFVDHILRPAVVSRLTTWTTPCVEDSRLDNALPLLDIRVEGTRGLVSEILKKDVTKSQCSYGSNKMLRGRPPRD